MSTPTLYLYDYLLLKMCTYTYSYNTGWIERKDYILHKSLCEASHVLEGLSSKVFTSFALWRGLTMTKFKELRISSKAHPLSFFYVLYEDPKSKKLVSNRVIIFQITSSMTEMISVVKQLPSYTAVGLWNTVCLNRCETKTNIEALAITADCTFPLI